MMYPSSWCPAALVLVLATALVPDLASAIPVPADAPALSSTRTSAKPKKGGVTIPFQRQRRLAERAAPEGNVVGGSVGLGDSQDL